MEREAAGANLCCHNLLLDKLINNKTVEIEANLNNLLLDKLINNKTVEIEADLNNLLLDKLIDNKTVEVNHNNLKLDKLFRNETNLTAEGLGEILCDGPCNTCSTRYSLYVFTWLTLLELSRLLEGVVSRDFGGWKHEITLMQVVCFLILPKHHLYLSEINNIHL